MDTTKEAVEDVRYFEGVAKKNQITWREIVPTKLDAKTAKRTTLPFLELAIYTKSNMEIIEVKYRRNITFLEARKIVESYMKVNTNAQMY